MTKILFFTTSSKYTGSEIALFNIVNNIKTKNIIPVGWISLRNGRLIKKLRPGVIAITFEESIKNVYFITILLCNLVKNVKSPNKSIKSILFQSFLNYIHRSIDADIWYVNTILQPEILSYAYQNNIPCIVHSHELEQMLVHLTKNEVENLIRYPKLIITCSNTAAQVMRVLGRLERIEINFPSIDTNRILSYNLDHQIYRDKLGISQNTFLWCMSGTSDTNKNPIRFADIAYRMLKRNVNCHFIWIGLNHDCALSVYLKKYTKILGIEKIVTWLEPQENEYYYQFLNCSNALILTSNKESFSIVTLEALYLKKPVLSFNCGGTSEILNDKIGKVIKSWNHDDMVDLMIDTMQDLSWFDPNLARQTALKFSLNEQINRFEKIILSI